MNTIDNLKSQREEIFKLNIFLSLHVLAVDPLSCKSSRRHTDDPHTRNKKKEPEQRKGRLVEPSTGKPWQVPREGFYLLSYTAARFPSEMMHVETSEGLAVMMDNIRHVRGTHSTSAEGVINLLGWGVREVQKCFSSSKGGLGMTCDHYSWTLLHEKASYFV